MNEEPTVLDYVKALLTPWKGPPPRIPPLPEELESDTSIKVAGGDLVVIDDAAKAAPVLAVETEEKPETALRKVVIPWRTFLLVVFATFAQSFIEPPSRNVTVAVVGYAVVCALMIWAFLSDEWQLLSVSEDTATSLSAKVKPIFLLASFPLILFAFLAFKGNRFTSLNLILWSLALLLALAALWLPGERVGNLKQELLRFFKHPSFNVDISSWTLLLLVSTLVVIFFRTYALDKIPNEMFSDHAEKLQDVAEVLDGRYSIFFPRNTGREAFQMYLTALIAVVFGTGLSFASLKIGTVLAGVVTLPYIYLLGREIGNKWVGLLAFILAGIAYWPNVISRIGLRFPLYPLFVAPALFYLIRGLRKLQRNDFILAGIAVGLGLHGYSPFRIVPFVIIFAVVLYILHTSSGSRRASAFWGLVIIGFFALIVFLPLLRYSLEYPDMFAFRAFSRLGTTERALPGPAHEIFFGNLWRAVIMYFWDNGNIWVHSVTGRPALDIVTAAVYFIGTIYLIARYARYRHWVDLFLLISVPLLMMPSILSLAFPDENPALNRASGAIVPVFIIAAIGLEGALTSIGKQLGKGLAVVLGLILIVWSASQNYDIVFRQFYKQFMGGAWNTSDIGHVIRAYADSIGSKDSAYVVPYPHWVDTRLVGVNAGYGPQDYALPRERIEETLAFMGPKLFIVNTADEETLIQLKKLYPKGTQKLFDSSLEGKDFIMYFVPEIDARR
ncbi:MAG: hypothetical protein HPY45_10325 [Anaerolineae bacterium]|nr:hypothetical protein [Anaerolineae bacterium]